MPHQHQSTGKPGLRERLAERFTRSEAEVEAVELQQDADRLGGTPIAELADRSEASVCGSVRSVTLRPRVNVPALVVELYDGSQSLNLVWLGRRQIGGHRAGDLPDRPRPGDLQERHPDDLQPGLRHQAPPWPLRSAPPRRPPRSPTRARWRRSRRSSGPGCRRRSAARAGSARDGAADGGLRRGVGWRHDVTDRRGRVRGRRAGAPGVPAGRPADPPLRALRRRPPPRSRRSSRCAAAGPQDAFLPGILASAGCGAAALVSVIARWPVVGFLVAAGDPRVADDPLGWRRDRGLVRVCQRLTMVLVGLYVLRVAVMLPHVPRR